MTVPRGTRCVRALWAAACLCVLSPTLAEARVERFAILIGNNRGEPDEAPLLYAESDAQRMSEVLRELGGFEPVNTVLLRGERIDTIRSTLITFNERIRDAMSEPDVQAVLLGVLLGARRRGATALG